MSHYMIFTLHKPVPVPLHYREEVKAGLKADVKRGVLRKVGPGEPTQWCAKMVIQPKKDGRVRRTVDFLGLTKTGIRETHHTRSPINVVCSIPRETFKSTLDCVNGYHGIPLAEDKFPCRTRKISIYASPSRIRFFK